MGAIHDETTSSREGCLRFQNQSSDLCFPVTSRLDHFAINLTKINDRPFEIRLLTKRHIVAFASFREIIWRLHRGSLCLTTRSSGASSCRLSQGAS